MDWLKDRAVELAIFVGGLLTAWFGLNQKVAVMQMQHQEGLKRLGDRLDRIEEDILRLRRQAHDQASTLTTLQLQAEMKRR
jgi:hypothetical protein